MKKRLNDLKKRNLVNKILAIDLEVLEKIRKIAGERKASEWIRDAISQKLSTGM